MFAYYSKWLQDFSDKLQPLATATRFPLDKKALDAFNLLKRELEEATLHIIDENLSQVGAIITSSQHISNIYLCYTNTKSINN